MIARLAGVFGFLAFLLVLWQECGESIPVFFYRLGLGAALSARSWVLATVPSPHSTYGTAQEDAP